MAYSPKPLVPPVAVVIGGLGLAAVAGLGLWAYEVQHAAITGWLQEVAAWMRAMPWPVFYLAVAFLPFVFFPVTLLYLSAGAVHGLWPSMAGILVATAINISISYWLAAGPLHNLIARWFVRRGRKVPVLPDGEHIWVVLAVRFTPAFPLFVQNCLLGLARVRFGTYFWVTLAAEAVFAFGYILAGEALTQDHPGYVLAAFGCIVAAVVVSRLLRGAFSKKVHPLAEGNPALQPAVAQTKKGEPAKGSPGE